jgi:hypothetical protein
VYEASGKAQYEGVYAENGVCVFIIPLPTSVLSASGSKGFASFRSISGHYYATTPGFRRRVL